MRALSSEEIAATLNALTGTAALRDRALFLTGIATGFRIGELLSLRVDDIRGALSSAPEAQIHVRRRSMKGKRRGRSVWIHETAREALRAYMATRPEARDNEFVFASREAGAKHSRESIRGRTAPYSQPIDRRWAWRLLKRAFRRAGIYDQTVATHSMRKTFAQEIHVASGNNLHVTQKALGHANIQSTVKYLGSVDADVKALILARRLY